MLIPNAIDHPISLVKVSCDNFRPPLNPIANKRYSDINFDELGGISNSLFNTQPVYQTQKTVTRGLLNFR